MSTQPALGTVGLASIVDATDTVTDFNPNSTFAEALITLVDGVLPLDLTSASIVLSIVQLQFIVFILINAPGTGRTITFPASTTFNRLFVNNCTYAVGVQIGSGTPYVLASGRKTWLYGDGTNVFDASEGDPVALGGAGVLLAANDLSDVDSASTSRTNLGLGTAATHDVPTSGNASSTEVVMGNDTRLVSAGSPWVPTAYNMTGNMLADVNYALGNSVSPITITMPSITDFGAGMMVCVNINSGAVTFDPHGTETINGVNSGFTLTGSGNYQMLMCDGTTGWWLLSSG